MRTMRSYVSVPWGEVHTRHAGGRRHDKVGDTALVLLHQTPLSSWVYEPALACFPPSVRAVALDTPGYGQSTAPPEGWDIPRYAAGLWETLDCLGIRRPVLLGHHTGAVIAVEAVLQQPDRALGLVLHGYPAFTPSERSKRMHDPGRSPIAPDLQGAYLDRIQRRVRTMYPQLDARTVARCVHDYLSCGPDFAVAYRAVFAYDLVGRLDDVVTPTFVCCGEDDLTYFAQERVRAALPAAPWHGFPRAGDFLAYERPEEFARAVQAFLQGFGR